MRVGLAWYVQAFSVVEGDHEALKPEMIEAPSTLERNVTILFRISDCSQYVWYFGWQEVFVLLCRIGRQP